ncbi:MAG: tandem-95 repeat protein [Gammaproteobacteria bacterium]|jgi:hypothetical protein|nr:tandem-95 repeat protein [Gammaproteobacteria bacterium]MBT4492571.1 tandem-95 repeat protein [Gammaproteobacteria bacterium]MBT7371047.1 tandem-95 repeat protein [Gammaproteobacteria bacterium]
MRNIFLLALSLLFLAACGGGGGGGGSSASAQPTSSAANDQASVDEESSVAIDVTSNDSRVDSASVAISSQPTSGSVEISGDQIVYTPDADFSGSDSFRYGVTGDDGTSLSATVNVTINDINDAPIAVEDTFTLVEDNTLELTLADNDSDIDDAITAFEIGEVSAGVVSGSGSDLTYTPPPDFVGDISFDYRAIDSRGAASNTVSVTITVEAVTATMLEVLPLSLPQSGYASANDSELGAAVLSSAEQSFDVSPNIVSVLLSLRGGDANIDEGGLFISEVVPPSGSFTTYQREVHFCFDGNCTSLVPRSPAYAAESGTWTFRLGTLASSLDDIDFSSLTLTATIRTGPTPDPASVEPAVLNLRSYLTSDSATTSDVEAVLTRLSEIAVESEITLDIEPVVVLSNASFDIVSTSFLNQTTSSLVNEGAANSVNLFFVEGFTDSESLAGISPGIPGSLGAVSGHNGVLIDATANLGFDVDFYANQNAETTFHEMNHFLGLYHTTEARFSFNDVIDDTPNCDPDVDDLDDDGVADAAECPDADNPMFWFKSALIERGPLTAGQKHVIFYSPLAAPGS